MLKVGITGGIGSGKSTVCRIFSLLGIPVLYADDAARMLMDTDPELVAAISALLGAEVYRDGALDRPAVSRIVFGQPEKLRQLNELVHPATIRYADRWMAAQQAPYALKEAALFFESGSHLQMDVMVGVDAPQEVRIARVMARSGLDRDEILQRMSRQMDNEEKMRRCTVVLRNDGETALIPQVLAVHERLLRQAAH